MTKRNARKSIKPSVRYKLLENSGGRCPICGRTVDRDGITLVIDHIIPVCQGGSNNPSNLRAICALCNTGKGYFDKNGRVVDFLKGSPPLQARIKKII